MAQVFVTGGRGYVGARLAPELTSAGHGVTLLDGDLREPRGYEDALAGHDVVVHLAAVTGKAPASRYASVNVEGTRALARVAQQAGVKRFILVSSIAARFADVRRYPYARSKIAAERLLVDSGLAWNVVRPTIILGSGAPVMEALTRLASAPVVPFFGGARARVQPVAVNDLVRGLAALCDDGWSWRPDAVYDFGGPDVLTMGALLERLRSRFTGKRLRSVAVPAAPLAATLWPLERLLLRWLPFTAGQLASFTQDGVAEPNELTDRLRPLTGLDDLLRSVTVER